MDKKICISIGARVGVTAIIIGVRYYNKKKAEKAAAIAAASSEAK